MSRVEEGRGGIAPFPLPAHRTGRADFPHPALRLTSPQGTRWTTNVGWCLATTPWHVTNLRLAAELPRKPSDTFRCYQAHRQSPILSLFESAPEVRVLSSAGITRPHRSYDPVRRPPGPPPIAVLEVRPPTGTGLHRLPGPPFQRAVPITPVDRNGCICRLLPHSTRPSPTEGRVGIHNFTFEACSDFTRVTARWIAQPPKAAFVTRLRDGQLPDRPARQLPDQPTTLWVASSSTGVPRLRGALSGSG